MGAPGYKNGFCFSLMPERLKQPLLKKKPTKYFVNSMSDLFHEDMPEEYLHKIMNTIHQTPHHIYQILTKRSERMLSFFTKNPVPKNVWLGVTAENILHGVPRIDHLRELNAPIKFLSVEPLLEDLGEINLKNIDWVIVGGESGKNARPMKEEWAINIKARCKEENVAFFFKQWGTWGADGIKRSKKNNGRLLEGKIYDAYPQYSI